jgi:hypothetical protein
MTCNEAGANVSEAASDLLRGPRRFTQVGRALDFALDLNLLFQSTGLKELKIMEEVTMFGSQ